MEIEKSVLTGKRKHPGGILVEEEKNGTKIIAKNFAQPAALRMSASLISPLITLDLHQLQTNDNRIFQKRSYRPSTENREFTFPETSEDCIREKLSFLLQYYSKFGKESRKETLPKPEFSDKETTLTLAAQLLLNGHYTISSVTRLTRLSRSLISSMSSRLSKTGYILPFKKKKKKKLLAKHINFICNMLQSEHGCLFTLKEMRLHVIQKFPDLATLSIWTLHQATSCLIKRKENEIKKQRKEASKKLIYALFEGYTVIFVDETSIQSCALPSYGW